jgi:hypothetical protein
MGSDNCYQMQYHFFCFLLQDSSSCHGRRRGRRALSGLHLLDRRRSPCRTRCPCCCCVSVLREVVRTATATVLYYFFKILFKANFATFFDTLKYNSGRNVAASLSPLNEMQPQWSQVTSLTFLTRPVPHMVLG